MEKIEMLNSIINITKKNGQGLALTIIRAKSSEYAEFVDELIKEGKVDIYVKTYSFFPSDEWVVPAGCYFAIKDDDTEHPGALIFMKMYLGIEDLGLGGVKIFEILKKVDYMERYTKWLKDNEKQLIDLINMKEVEFIPNQLDDNTKNWIKSKKWYTNNDTIKSCFEQSLKAENDDKQKLDLYLELNPLYKLDRVKYSKEIYDTDEKIENIKDEMKNRNIVNKWFRSQTQTDKIQTLIN